VLLSKLITLLMLLCLCAPAPASAQRRTSHHRPRTVHSVPTQTAPTGATARCRDGADSFSAHQRGTRFHHGGVAQWLP
jgi:hypothetical protein